MASGRLTSAVSFLALASSVIAFPRAALADGELDESFSEDGISIRDLGSPSDQVAAVQITPNGRIVVAGDTLTGGSRDLVVSVFTSAGTPDPTFAGTGRATADFGGDEQARAIAVHRDGSIVAVGTRVKDDTSEVVLVRYLASGTLDTSFNGSGRRVIAFTDGADSFGNAIALELDGRIVIGGTRTNANGSVIAIARLRRDGSFDTSLNGNGKKFIDYGIESGRDAFGNAVAVQDDRKIVVAGTRTGAGGSDFAVARIDPDGEFDEGFDGSGKTDVDFGPTDEGQAMAIRPDGRIAIAGTRTTASGSDFAVALLRTDGRLDSAFDGNGKATTDFGAEERAHAMIAQLDGKLLVVGEREGEVGRDFAFARYEENGALDPTLDEDGKLRIDVAAGSLDTGTGVALTADGAIVAAGTTRDTANSDLALLRLLSTLRVPAGSLELPGAGSTQSGIGLISGWLCSAPSVKVRIDGSALVTTAYGTARSDTAAVCGDADNGFGLLFNWNLLGDGPHIIRAFAQGQQFAAHVFDVQTLGSSFLRGAEGAYTLQGFPEPGSSVDVSWSEGLQGFVLRKFEENTAAAGPAAAASPESPAATTGQLENPSAGSFQSGIGIISGWVCDADVVEIRLDGGAPLAAAHGTARGDTEGMCGDSDNGFGLLFNWNLLDDGAHTIEARADGQVLGTASFTVTTLGESFLRGASGTFDLEDFPEDGSSVEVTWSEGQQNFVITGFE
jgi:uncharacterized delta-60 repeat protein